MDGTGVVGRSTDLKWVFVANLSEPVNLNLSISVVNAVRKLTLHEFSWSHKLVASAVDVGLVAELFGCLFSFVRGALVHFYASFF